MWFHNSRQIIRHLSKTNHMWDLYKNNLIWKTWHFPFVLKALCSDAAVATGSPSPTQRWLIRSEKHRCLQAFSSSTSVSLAMERIFVSLFHMAGGGKKRKKVMQPWWGMTFSKQNLDELESRRKSCLFLVPPRGWAGSLLVSPGAPQSLPGLFPHLSFTVRPPPVEGWDHCIPPGLDSQLA